MTDDTMPAMDKQVVHVKGKHLDRLAQTSRDMLEFGRCLDLVGIELVIDQTTAPDHVPAPSVSPVDAGEAREVAAKDLRFGDRATITGVISETNGWSIGHLLVTEPGVGEMFLEDTTITVTRPVSPPLPTERGIHGTIRPCGGPARYNAMTVEADGRVVVVASDGSEHEITVDLDFRPLPSPVSMKEN
jgi:hypothetical protein